MFKIIALILGSLFLNFAANAQFPAVGEKLPCLMGVDEFQPVGTAEVSKGCINRTEKGKSYTLIYMGSSYCLGCGDFFTNQIVPEILGGSFSKATIRYISGDRKPEVRNQYLHKVSVAAKGTIYASGVEDYNKLEDLFYVLPVMILLDEKSKILVISNEETGATEVTLKEVKNILNL